jgi:2'-5' RNA ligase
VSDELPERIRAFVAVRIPTPQLVQLTALQDELKRKFTDVSRTRPEAMHLTLQFLGNVESARLDQLKQALSDASREIRAFNLQFSAPGSFGDRVLWVGVAGDVGDLTHFAESIRAATKSFGSHEEERAFNAHVTLGRFRGRGRQVASTLRTIRVPVFTAWLMDEIELIRSELSPRGARYTTLAEFRLRMPQS